MSAADRHAAAPSPAFRLVPSRYPPIGVFDTVATAADLHAVFDLVGWTNDRLVSERINRLPPSEWVYGRPNSSVVMAAFLHVAPGGSRFNGPELGAWYAADELRTAGAEVGHHLRREAAATGKAELSRLFRCYSARPAGDYVDIRGQAASRPDIYAPDSYAASQRFGEAVRAGGAHGILYDSVRRAGGVNVVAYRPSSILDVLQTDHYEIVVRASDPRIDIHRVNST
jgi:hypothetical protein